MILEEESEPNEAKPFRMARDVYKSCMDVGKIQDLGLEPIKQILEELGGWPVLLGPNGTWTSENNYIWYEQVYKFREIGYSVDYLIDFSVTTDLKNSSWRILDLDQPGLGMSREYLTKGLYDEDVQVCNFLIFGYLIFFAQSLLILIGYISHSEPENLKKSRQKKLVKSNNEKMFS